MHLLVVVHSFLYIAITLILHGCSDSSEHHPPRGAALTLLSSKSAAKCLDGSPGGFYMDAASSTSDANKWVLWLDGGGECSDAETCSRRSREALGSSNHFRATSDLSSWYYASSDPRENPGLATWNRVRLLYCSQDLWSGTRTSATNSTFGFYFSGHLIFQEVVRHLTINKNLGEATDVVLSGGSAGGIGTWLNVGWLKNELKPTTRVVLAPLAGFYGFAFPYTGPAAIPMQYTDFRESAWKGNIALWQSHYDESCKKALGDESYRCMLSNYSRQHINVSAFVVEAQTDSVQLQAHDCVPPPAFWKDQTRKYVEAWKENMTIAMHYRLLPDDGYFFPACFVHTDFSKRGPLIVDNKSGDYIAYGQAFAMWYSRGFGRWEDNCGILCGQCVPGLRNRSVHLEPREGGVILSSIVL